jgi:hypothetical protein
VRIFPVIVFLCMSTLLPAQDSLRNVQKKKTRLIASSALLSSGSLIALQQAWYKQYNTGRFHFFDDGRDWLQMDKAGHVFTTYQCGRLMIAAMKDCGYSDRRSLAWGSASGVLYMTAIECMDGFSRGWGFSWWDEAANVTGAAIAGVQELLWKRQKIYMKFSYFPTEYAVYNKPLLGRNDATRVLKDYNGQTYWISYSPAHVVKGFPRWLCLSAGYGVSGLLGGTTNPVIYEDGRQVVFSRARRYFFSLDIDLTEIPVKRLWMRRLFSALNMLKIPAPAVEFRSGSFYVHPLYY